MNLDAVFLTGLTTGGLTCLAVQGGLLATTLTRSTRIESDNRPRRRTKRGRRGHQRHEVVGIQLKQNLWPIVYFMAAKLLAYTVLGFLLGTLGSVIQLTPTVRAMMQVLAGLFMLATALNMLNVHPIFRYVVLQPPKALTRLLRNQAKSEDMFAPVLLGVMTVLIPCGTTQAMQLLAITSGSPVLGALILFAFVLGTSPTFLILGFLATRLRGKLQRGFTFATVLAILFLGFASVDGGLNLVGSPYAPGRILATLFPSRALAASAMARDVGDVQEVTIDARNNGYFPNTITAEAGKPIRLRMISVDSFACTRAFLIPNLGIQNILPTSGETLIEVPAQPPGTLYFTCGMGMYGGAIIVG